MKGGHESRTGDRVNRVVVVGAGPVGLFLACLLAKQEREVIVLERRETVASFENSRSIGVHPPALEALHGAGMAEPLIECGVAIRRAQVFDEGRRLGVLSLAGCPPPYPFVLSLPQGVTEALFARRLETLAPGSLRRGVEVAAVDTRANGVTVELADGTQLEASFLVACDGHRSATRRSLPVESTDRSSGHHYLMADLPESSDLDGDAAIYLGGMGVVESFPLPPDRRRWVARLDSRPGEASLELLARAVEERTGQVLPATPATPATAFTAETRLNRPLAGRRWALAGDAAHVVSPIGGQGMNLGLLGARSLVEAGFGSEGTWSPARYDRLQRRRARLAARRAGLNMALGSDAFPPLLRRFALRTLLLPGLSDQAARYFTMRGL